MGKKITLAFEEGKIYPLYISQTLPGSDINVIEGSFDVYAVTGVPGGQEVFGEIVETGKRYTLRLGKGCER